MSRPEGKASATFHIVTDATGNLIVHTLRAILTQFPDLNVREKFHILIRTEADLLSTLESIESDGLVFHTLVRTEWKDRLAAHCEENGIPHYDVTGPLADFIASHTGVEQRHELHRVHRVDDSYLRRIEAMEFTAQHDDNRRLESIGEADIVIVGASRVSKSPTSTFLGSMGFKVANVAVAAGIDFPTELEAAKDRIVAFTMQPKALQEIRARRFQEFDEEMDRRELDPLGYGDLRMVIREVMEMERRYREHEFPILDITARTVEENSAKVLKMLGLKAPPA